MSEDLQDEEQKKELDEQEKMLDNVYSEYLQAEEEEDAFIENEMRQLQEQYDNHQNNREGREIIEERISIFRKMQLDKSNFNEEFKQLVSNERDRISSLRENG